MIRTVPIARTGHVLVPEMVGQRYALKAVLLGIFQYIFRRLLGIGRALRYHRMDVIVVIEYVFHTVLLLLYPSGFASLI